MLKFQIIYCVSLLEAWLQWIFLPLSLHAHAWFLRLKSQKRTGWLKVRASAVRSWDLLDWGEGKDWQKRVPAARVLVKESPGEVRSDRNRDGEASSACHHCWFHYYDLWHVKTGAELACKCCRDGGLPSAWPPPPTFPRVCGREMLSQAEAPSAFSPLGIWRETPGALH